MKIRLIFSIMIVSLIILTGCESKTDKLENKINELESQINDMSTSTTTSTTTTTTIEFTTTSSSTKSTKKRTTTTTAQPTTKKANLAIPTYTTKPKKLPIVKDVFDDEGKRQGQKYGYKLCDDDKKCTCYFDNEAPYTCE